MRILDAENILRNWSEKGRYVFMRADLAKLLGEQSQDTLSATLKRLVKAGVLVRAAHNVYVYAHSGLVGATTLEDIALVLRKGEYVYESYESALSQWGLISQVPIDRITCATTGRSGEYRTPYGVIEFTHTQQNPLEIVNNIVRRPGHALPIANEKLALVNLRRSGRNIDMVREDAR